MQRQNSTFSLHNFELQTIYIELFPHRIVHKSVYISAKLLDVGNGASHDKYYMFNRLYSTLECLRRIFN